MAAKTPSLRKAVADCTVATISLVEAVEQPEYFDDGDDVVPTGKPSGNLGRRPKPKGAAVTDDIFPETGDPDSGDAVAHVAYPDKVEAAPTYKSVGQVFQSATAITKIMGGKKGIAADIAETMDDLSGALHELREVESALVARRQRTQDTDTEIEDARELSASVGQ